VNDLNRAEAKKLKMAESKKLVKISGFLGLVG
jgi:hypothetical protein